MKLLKGQLRILVFSDPKIDVYRSFVKALSLFASVKEVNWHYRPILGVRHVWLKIPYRMMEGFYWILRLFKESHHFRADIIVAQYAHFGGLIGAVAAKLMRKKFVVRVVGSDLKIQSRSLAGSTIVHLIFKIASGVICVSKDLEDIALSFRATNTIVIPAPLDLSGFHERNLSKENRQVITVARLIPIKGISYLIKAMTSVKDAKLLIIGDGSERRMLERLALKLGLGNNVSFIGWIDHGYLFWEYLQQSTVFVLPSLSEGCPRAIIEAMACGLPVVATKVGGVSEVIVDGVNGFFVPPRDEKALAEAIEKALSDTNFQKEASVKNREMAKKHLFPIIGQRTYEFLKEIAFT